jgi:hypothetical protein
MYVGYQDDQYFRSSIREFLLYEPVLLAALEADGHELQPSKSKVWIPALDAVEMSDAPVQARELWGRYGRARHGLVALGSSAQGQAETRLGRDGTVALDPVRARAARAAAVVRAARDMAEQQHHPQAMHAAWTLLHSSPAHAFDYDARLVGAARLEPVVGPVYEQLRQAVSAIAGAWTPLQRAGCSWQVAWAGAACGRRRWPHMRTLQCMPRMP